METPEFLHGHASELMTIEHETAEYRRMWAVVLGLVPLLDGDQYCVLWGADIQSGVAGFGSTPIEAMRSFDQAMYAKAPIRNTVPEGPDTEYRRPGKWTETPPPEETGECR